MSKDTLGRKAGAPGCQRLYKIAAIGILIAHEPQFLAQKGLMAVIDIKLTGNPLLKGRGQIVPDNVAVVGAVKMAVAIQIRPADSALSQFCQSLVGEDDFFGVGAVDDAVTGHQGLCGAGGGG